MRKEIGTREKKERREIKESEKGQKRKGEVCEKKEEV